MKDSLAILSIVSAIVGTAPSLCAAAGGTIAYSRVGGKDYAAIITKKALSRSPEWRQEDENPPISARKAMKLAAKKKDLFFGDESKEWRFESVSLTKLWENWYWVARYQPRAPSKARQELRIVVLMDGTVIQPTLADGTERNRLYDEDKAFIKGLAPAPAAGGRIP